MKKSLYVILLGLLAGTHVQASWFGSGKSPSGSTKTTNSKSTNNAKGEIKVVDSAKSALESMKSTASSASKNLTSIAKNISAYGNKMNPDMGQIQYKKMQYNPLYKEMTNTNRSVTYEYQGPTTLSSLGNNLNKGDRFTIMRDGTVYEAKATYSNLPARTISDTIRTTRQTLESAGSAIKSGTSYVAKNMYNVGVTTANAIKTGATHAGEGLLSFGNKTSELVFKPKTNSQSNFFENNKNTDLQNSNSSNINTSNTSKNHSQINGIDKMNNFLLQQQNKALNEGGIVNGKVIYKSRIGQQLQKE